MPSIDIADTANNSSTEKPWPGQDSAPVGGRPMLPYRHHTPPAAPGHYT